MRKAVTRFLSTTLALCMSISLAVPAGATSPDVSDGDAQPYVDSWDALVEAVKHGGSVTVVGDVVNDTGSNLNVSKDVTIDLQGNLDLGQGHVNVTGRLDIESQGSSIVNGTGANGGAFYVETGAELSLTGVTLQGAQSEGYGGSVANYGILTLNDVTITGNSADSGGAVFNNGALELSGQVTMTENSAEVGQNLLLGYNSKLSVSDDLQGSVGLSVGALDGAMETALVTPWEKADTKPFHSDVAGRYVTIQYDEGSGNPCLYFGQQSTNGYTTETTQDGGTADYWAHELYVENSNQIMMAANGGISTYGTVGGAQVNTVKCNTCNVTVSISDSTDTRWLEFQPHDENSSACYTVVNGQKFGTHHVCSGKSDDVQVSGVTYSVKNGLVTTKCKDCGAVAVFVVPESYSKNIVMVYDSDKNGAPNKDDVHAMKDELLPVGVEANAQNSNGENIIFWHICENSKVASWFDKTGDHQFRCQNCGYQYTQNISYTNLKNFVFSGETLIGHNCHGGSDMSTNVRNGATAGDMQTAICDDCSEQAQYILVDLDGLSGVRRPVAVDADDIGSGKYTFYSNEQKYENYILAHYCEDGKVCVIDPPKDSENLLVNATDMKLFKIECDECGTVDYISFGCDTCDNGPVIETNLYGNPNTLGLHTCKGGAPNTVWGEYSRVIHNCKDGKWRECEIWVNGPYCDGRTVTAVWCECGQFGQTKTSSRLQYVYKTELGKDDPSNFGSGPKDPTKHLFYIYSNVIDGTETLKNLGRKCEVCGYSELAPVLQPIVVEKGTGQVKNLSRVVAQEYYSAGTTVNVSEAFPDIDQQMKEAGYTYKDSITVSGSDGGQTTVNSDTSKTMATQPQQGVVLTTFNRVYLEDCTVTVNVGVPGKENQTITVPYGQKVELKKDDSITWEGHNFVGFFYDQNGMQPYDQDKPITDDTNVYMVWGRTQNTVTLDYQMDEIPDGSISVNYGEKVDTTANSALLDPTSRPGYTVEGWYTEPQCENPFDFSSTVVTHDITLYAKWSGKEVALTVKTYTMGVDGHYGEAVVTTAQGNVGTEYTHSVSAPEGFYVDYENSKLTTTPDGLGGTNDEILVYMGRNQYRITYYQEDGTSVYTVESWYYQQEVEYAEGPVLSGKDFKGWMDMSTNQMVKDENDRMPASNMNLRAVYEQGTASVTVELYVEDKLGNFNKSDVQFVVDGQTVGSNYTLDEDVLDALIAGLEQEEQSKLEGYQFDADNPSGQLSVVVSEVEGSNVLLVYMERKSFGIKWYNGNQEVKSETVRYMDTLTPPVVTKEGYTLIGWKIDNGQTVSDLSTYEVPADGIQRLDAVWSIAGDVAVTVNVFQMDTTGKYPSNPTSSDTTSAKVGSVYTWNESLPTGFYLDTENGQFKQSLTVSENPVDNVLSIYMARNQYTITYYTDETGLTVHPDVDAAQVYYGAGFVNPSCEAEEGYAHKGWAIVGGDGSIIRTGTTVTGNMSVYPIFEKVNETELEDGTKIEVDEDGTITENDDGDTVINGNGTITTPGGVEVDVSGETVIDKDTGEITTSEGATVTVPGNSEVVTKGETVINPEGGIDCDDGATITLPGGIVFDTDEPVHVNPDGSVEFEGETTVEGYWIGTITLPDGGDLDNTGRLTTDDSMVIDASGAPDTTITVGGGASISQSESLKTEGSIDVTHDPEDGFLISTDGKAEINHSHDIVTTNPIEVVDTDGDRSNLDKGGVVNINGTIKNVYDQITLPDGTIITGETVTNGDDRVTADGDAHMENFGNDPVDVEADGEQITVNKDAGMATVDDGSVTVKEPVGSGDSMQETVVTTDDGKIVVDKDGNIDADGQGGVNVEITVDDGEGHTSTVTVEGDEVHKDGNVTEVTDGDTTITVEPQEDGTVHVTVDENGNKAEITTDGDVTVDENHDMTVDLDDGESVTVQPSGVTVEVPGGGEVVVHPDGTVDVPAGGEVTLPDGTEIVLPDGGTVKPDGSIDINPDEDGDREVIINDTKVENVGGELEVDENGDVHGQGGTTTVTEPDGDKTIVTGDDSDVTVDGEGNITVEGGDVVHENADGSKEVEKTVVDDEGNIVKINITTTGTLTEDENGTITADGGVTDVTVVKTNQDGTNKETSAHAENCVVTVDKNGDITIQEKEGEDSHWTVETETDDGKDVTVEGSTDATVDTDGNVHVEESDDGGDQTKVTITDPDTGDKTEITTDGDVTVDGSTGKTEVDGTEDTNTKVEHTDGETGDKTTVENNGGDVTVDPDTGKITTDGGDTTIEKDTYDGKITVENSGGKTETDTENGTIHTEGGNTTVTEERDDGTSTKTEVEGGTVDVDQDGNVTVEDSDKTTVTNEDENGNKTEVEISGDVTVDKDGNVEITEDGTLTDKDGEETEIPGGSVVHPDGGYTKPDGTEVDPDGTETKPSGEIVLPDGSKIEYPDNTKIDEDGTIHTDDETTITKPDGTEIVLPDGGTVKPDGTVTVEGGQEVVITKPDGTEITVTPDEGGSATVNSDGSVDAGASDVHIKYPDGTTVDITEATDTKIDGDGTVTTDGKIHEDQANGTTVDLTGGEVDPSGNIDAGTGTGIVVEHPNGNEVTVPADQNGHVDVNGDVSGTGPVTVQPGDKPGMIVTTEPGKEVVVHPDGTIEYPGSQVGNKTEITDEDGNKTVIETPEGGEVVVHPDGTVDVPEGGKVTVTDPETGEETTIDMEHGGTVNPDGTVTENPDPNPSNPGGPGGGGGHHGGSSGGGSSSSGDKDDDDDTMNPEKDDFMGLEDVDPDDWYHKAVVNAIYRGYFDIDGLDAFGANNAITRAEAAYVIKHAMEANARVDDPDSALAFKDVTSSTKWLEELSWSYDNGVFAGYGDWLMGPEDTLTREQFAMIMYRVFGQYLDDGTYVNLENFVDHKSIGAWSREAVQWAVNHSFIVGTNDGRIDPQGDVTKAQVATIIMRIVTTLEEEYGDDCPVATPAYVDGGERKAEFQRLYDKLTGKG